MTALLSRLPTRARQTLVIGGAVGFAVLAGAMTTSLTGSYGATKVIWVFLAAIVAAAATTSIRLGLVALALGLSFPFRSRVLVGYEVHSTHLLILAFAVPVLSAMRFGELRPAKGIMGPLALMVAGGAIGSLAGVDASGSLFRLVTGLIPALLVVVVISAAVRSGPDLKMLALVFAFCLLGTDIVAALEAAGRQLPGLPVFEKGRVNGFFFHPNILGGYIDAVLLLLLGIAINAWRRLPLAPLTFGLPIGFGVAALAFTQSRGALIGLAAGLAVLLVVTVFRRGVLPVITLLLVVAVALVIVVPRVPESQRAAFTQRFQKLTQPGAESGRLSIYKAARHTIAAHPFTGVGPLAFGVQENRRADFPGLPPGLLHAHNLFLETYLSLGPIGMVGFLWLLGGALLFVGRIALVHGRSRGDPITIGWASGSLAALTALIVHGMVDFIFWQEELLVLLMILLGIGWSLRTGDDAESDIRPAS